MGRSAPGSESFPAGIFVAHHDVARPIDWRAQFGNTRGLHLEIGFGLGEFLIREAADRPDENFVGLELDWPRIYKCLQRITALRARPGNSGSGDNLRLLKVDARVALQRLFLPATIEAVTCLFPCPWPKKSHVKHRLFSTELLCLLNSRMKDGAAVRIVTDWRPYFDWIREQLDGTGFAASHEMVAPQFGTKFERKWRESGQEKFWELRLVKEEHCEVPVLEDVPMKVHFFDDFDPEHFHLENLIGEVSVIFKDMFFDRRQNKGLVRLVVAEKFLTQHVWAAIVKSEGRWFVAKAEGHSALPTSGVALALERVYAAAVKSAQH